MKVQQLDFGSLYLHLGDLKQIALLNSARIAQGGPFLLYCPSNLSLQTFETYILPQFEHALSLKNKIKIIYFDLTYTTQIDLTAMLNIILLISYSKQQLRCKQFLIPPASKVTRHFLERWNFFKIIELDCCPETKPSYDTPQKRGGKISDVLLSISRIKMDQDVYDTVGRFNKTYMEQCLSQFLSYEKRDIPKFKEILSEICGNIPRHSKSWGLVAVRATVNFKKRRVDSVQVSIADRGIGIPASLSEKYGPEGWSDLDALIQAFHPNVSRFEGGGKGLYQALEAVKALRGEIIVRSQTARHQIHFKNQNRTTIHPIKQGNLIFFIGTQFDIRLPNLATFKQ